jgi:hypothetical protein
LYDKDYDSNDFCVFVGVEMKLALGLSVLLLVLFLMLFPPAPGSRERPLTGIGGVIVMMAVSALIYWG